jgi:hypothetical protein
MEIFKMTYDIKVIMEGVEYELERKSEHREGDPISFEFTKKDMEYFMYALDITCKVLDENNLYSETSHLKRIKRDLQQRIDKTIERGNWK